MQLLLLQPRHGLFIVSSLITQIAPQKLLSSLGHCLVETYFHLFWKPARKWGINEKCATIYLFAYSVCFASKPRISCCCYCWFSSCCCIVEWTSKQRESFHKKVKIWGSGDISWQIALFFCIEMILRLVSWQGNLLKVAAIAFLSNLILIIERSEPCIKYFLYLLTPFPQHPTWHM